MESPSATFCGICGHPEHSTPQCPSIYDNELQEVMLLSKMRQGLIEKGWTLGTDPQPQMHASSQQPAPDTPTRPTWQAANNASPA